MTFWASVMTVITLTPACLSGIRNGSAIFQHISDVLRHIMHQRQFDIINYIDDILGVDIPSRIDASFDTLQRLLHVLGFEISEKKLEKPSTQLNCIGIIVDTKEFTVSIPKPKLQEIINTCNAWRHKTHCNKHQLQSLLGSLLYISKCVKMTRFFVNRLLDVLHSMEVSQVPLTFIYLFVVLRHVQQPGSYCDR